MVMVRPFRALRPSAADAPRVASPPYDVVNTAEARALAADNPLSFLHVARPEIDLPDGTDPHDPAVYLRGASNLRDLETRGILQADPTPRLYVYAQQMGDHRQRGVVGCVSVAEYDADIIRKHEKTRADKEDDRTLHVHALGAHDEPVFLTFRADAAVQARIDMACAAEPVYDFTTADAVRHTLWVLSDADSAALSEDFLRVPALYVADGHHRSAAASRVHALRRGDAGEHGVFLAVVFPDDAMQILAYHRLARDPAGRSPAALLEALASVLEVTPVDGLVPPGPKTLGLLVGGRWYHGAFRAGTYDPSDPVAALDVSLCQQQVLSGILGIHDPRRDANVDFVGGIRGTPELERRVRDEGWSLAIALHPTSMADLLAVSDAGRLMPPKSTWFEPKLRSGLFVHRL